MRGVSGRGLRVISRIVFFVCGLLSLLTAVPYVILRGGDLPVASEWVLFVVVLALIGGFSVAVAVLPASWTAKACRMERDSPWLFATPFKLVGVFAVISYLLALGAFFSPRTWNLNPLLMLALCPMYLIRMSIDPSRLAVLFLFAPMNAATFGALGLTCGYLWFALRGKHLGT